MPKVSVIVPVYNVEQWLEEALDSLLAQTSEDIEIVCVNDGSVDRSAEILEQYRKTDNRIKVLTQENQGLSCARNAGISAAAGAYLYFMDSDDKIVPRALEKLYQLANREALDILYFDAKPFWDVGYSPDNEFKPRYHRKTPIQRFPQARNWL